MRFIKTIGKNLLCFVLEHQVKALQKRHQFKLIGVCGSIGKTSTKLTIAKLLQTSGQRVCFQTGNYNDRLTVPLILFGQNEPGLFNVFAWLKIVFNNHRQLKAGYDYDFAVVELGTDGPGQMKRFNYLKLDLLVLTAISEEHMEQFKTMSAVTKEELTLADKALKLLVNIDDCPLESLSGLTFAGYGETTTADYRLVNYQSKGIDGSTAEVSFKGEQTQVSFSLFGRQGALISLAALAAADQFSLSREQIVNSMASLPAVSGRMQLLAGIMGSRLIDDTYNASPKAVCSALDVLYQTESPQRIAILGSMNELGDYSPEAHRIVGNYCLPDKLSLVVTIGKQAREFLAPIASERGCQVKSFNNPKLAGEAVASLLVNQSVVLAKGSQNGVYAEEALKVLLANPLDAAKLVRQSTYWQGQKQALLDLKD